MTSVVFEPDSCEASVDARAASFRDPAGSVFLAGGRILRVINPAGAADLTAFLASRTAQKRIAAGDVARTKVLAASEIQPLLSRATLGGRVENLPGQMLVEHERVWFPTFPYEWPPEMLHQAARLTLDLARELLPEGLGLKDATPYNVLFRGPEPVFIDLLSVERRDPGDPTWMPEAQFARTFLLPLLANKRWGLSLDQILTARRDGLEPQEVYRWLGPLQRLAPPFLTLVSLPTWLSARHNPDDSSIYQKRSLANHEKAGFILRCLLDRLGHLLRALEPREGNHSAWSGYMAAKNPYTPQQFARKQAFVEQVLEEFHPQTVLDVGSNAGHFSSLAARSGARVVAIDADPIVVGDTWRKARSQGLDILPLVINLARPSPGVGWRNRECMAFLERARGAFDAVLMLASIHHMLVSERLPLTEILGLAAELTTNLLVIEFIGPDDLMFRRLARGSDHLYTGLNRELFETVSRRHFAILRSERLENSSRWLYLLGKRR